MVVMVVTPMLRNSIVLDQYKSGNIQNNTLVRTGVEIKKIRNKIKTTPTVRTYI